MLTSALWSSRSRTIFGSLNPAATIKAVPPLSSWALTSAPRVRRASATLTRPLLTATVRTGTLALSLALTLAPASIRDKAAAGSSGSSLKPDAPATSSNCRSGDGGVAGLVDLKGEALELVVCEVVSGAGAQP